MLKPISPVLRTVTLFAVAAALVVVFFALFYSNGSAGPEQRLDTAIAALAIVAGFAALVFLPMLPGLLELRRSADATSLTIDQNYSRDPRYMGKSFREKISNVLQSAPMHTRMPFLNRSKEYGRIVPSLNLDDGENWTDAVLSKGAVTTGKRVHLVDLYAQGDVRIGAGSTLRALAADGDVQLESNVSVIRWIDGEKDVRVGPNANLGHSLSAVGAVELGNNVRFSRICGNPVVVGQPRVDRRGPAPDAGSWPLGNKRKTATTTVTIGRGESVETDLVTRSNVEVLEGGVVKGSIKGDDVIVGPNAVVYGNVVARGDVMVRDGGAIRGHVFAEGSVFLSRDSVVGSAGRSKTLYSSRNVELADGATVFGWVICEGDGTTVSTSPG